MSEKGCLQHLKALYTYQSTCFLNISVAYLFVYVSFDEIMLSLQNFYGIFACCTTSLKYILFALSSLLKTMRALHKEAHPKIGEHDNDKTGYRQD